MVLWSPRTETATPRLPSGTDVRVRATVAIAAKRGCGGGTRCYRADISVRSWINRQRWRPAASRHSVRWSTAGLGTWRTIMSTYSRIVNRAERPVTSLTMRHRFSIGLVDIRPIASADSPRSTSTPKRPAPSRPVTPLKNSTSKNSTCKAPRSAAPAPSGPHPNGCGSPHPSNGTTASRDTVHATLAGTGFTAAEQAPIDVGNARRRLRRRSENSAPVS